MTYPTKPTGDNLVSETYIFAKNNVLKIPMTSNELLDGYNNKGESETELTSIPDAKKFNSFWYQIHNTLVWLVQYAEELFTAKFDKTGGTLTGSLNMSNNKVTNVADATNALDAINKQQLDAVIASMNALNADIVQLGNLTSNFTLLADRIHTGAILSSCTLSLPTLSSSAKFVNCMIMFTITSGQTLTLPSNIKWNYGVVPVFNTTSGVQNRIIFDTVDGGANWTAYYSQVGS